MSARQGFEGCEGSPGKARCTLAQLQQRWGDVRILEADAAGPVLVFKRTMDGLQTWRRAMVDERGRTHLELTSEEKAGANTSANDAARSDTAGAAICLTIGVGKDKPQGRTAQPSGGVAGLASWLNQREPEGLNTWWSFHSFLDGYCAADRYPTDPAEPGFPRDSPWLAGKGGWIGAWGVGVDVDYCSSEGDDPKHTEPLTVSGSCSSSTGSAPSGTTTLARPVRCTKRCARHSWTSSFTAVPVCTSTSFSNLRRVFWSPRGWCVGPDGKREAEERNAQVIVMRPEAACLEEIAKAADRGLSVGAACKQCGQRRRDRIENSTQHRAAG